MQKRGLFCTNFSKQDLGNILNVLLRGAQKQLNSHVKNWGKKETEIGGKMLLQLY